VSVVARGQSPAILQALANKCRSEGGTP
jgi:hypothetical protein